MLTFFYVQSSVSCCDTSVLTVWLGLGVRNENVLAYLGFFSTNKLGNAPKVSLKIPCDQWKLFQQLSKISRSCCHSQPENVPTSRQKYHISLPLIWLEKSQCAAKISMFRANKCWSAVSSSHLTPLEPLWYLYDSWYENVWSKRSLAWPFSFCILNMNLQLAVSTIPH